jgi:hypothetical protein
MQLYQPPAKKKVVNDPYMINPKGLRILVPEDRVSELLAKGFILEDREWVPLVDEKKEDPNRNFPIARSKLVEDAQKQIDTLDVWEV